MANNKNRREFSPKSATFIVKYTDKDSSIYKALEYHLFMAEVNFIVKKDGFSNTIDGKKFPEQALQFYIDHPPFLDMACEILGIRYQKGQDFYYVTLP